MVSQDSWVIKMGLNNIHRSKQKVLNRPMFAKMKDGTIKPVQYANVGLAIAAGQGVWQVGKSGLPYLIKGGKKIYPQIKNLPAIIKSKLPTIFRGSKTGTAPPSGAGIKEVLPLPSSRAPVPYGAFNAGAYAPTKGQILKTGLFGMPTFAGGVWGLNELLKGKEEEEVITEKGSAPLSPGTGEGSYGRREQAFDEESAVPKGKNEKDKAPPDANKIETEIKKGTLDDLIKERIDIFEKYLGDGKDTVRSGGFAALTEFGLNLASARGGNLMDKIARSAKDPLKTFTAIGMAAKDRADKIKMAGVKAGIEAEQAALDRAAEADPEGTTFQRNLGTLRTMFTDKDGNLTIAEEDLVNMAKSGATTSRKEFAAQIYAGLGGTQNPSTLKQYTDAEIVDIINRGWAVISGEQPVVEEEVEEKKEVISLD